MKRTIVQPEDLSPEVEKLLQKLRKEQKRLSDKLGRNHLVRDGAPNAELIDDASDVVVVSTHIAQNGNREGVLRAIEEKISQIEKTPGQVYVCQRGSQCVGNGQIDPERLACEPSMFSMICGPCALHLEKRSRRTQVGGFGVGRQL